MITRKSHRLGLWDLNACGDQLRIVTLLVFLVLPSPERQLQALLQEFPQRQELPLDQLQDSYHPLS